MWPTVYHLAVNTNIGSTAIGQNISSLITNTGTWIAGLGVGGGGLMTAFHGLMLQTTGGDPSLDAHHRQAIRKVITTTALIGGAGVVAHFAGGLL